MTPSSVLHLPRSFAALLLGLLVGVAPVAAAQREKMPGPSRLPAREVADHEHARDDRQRGQNRSFEELYGRARSVGRGEYLGVEPDISRNIYRFKFLRANGKVIWVDMDGRTGKVIAETM
jgi:hypothetical protein